ncbi:DNA helicase IV [Bifidobacterium bohemicum]|uniref:Superfamily I DNA and RNA helicase n=1 Tax=Bifidobacterium bohemicum DSM 22767 TaxID=1437606 RepID=A0A086ZGG1_9BIFI|nr:ATP-dependent DNA helicase [Bifidobacterium bohemicum]KFI45611.1 superfamily I DNA and RNA helicase [Bifidobacterium bohemicum DSM 22767]SCC00668.1 DNA helicase IV [Bifidobacterium bohemicum]
MSRYSSQIHEEQQAVTHAYTRLDALRETTRQRLDAVRAAGSHGSPTMRTERDSFATMYEDRLTGLRAVEDRLVFGRLDDNAGQKRYIGRIGLLDDDHESILTDWRAEAARPFYEATPSHHGNIAMRRHITLKFREVVGIEDEVLDVDSTHVGAAEQAGTLAGEGALIASLNSKRTGKMSDIVETIQAEQDRIIRAPLDRATIVQGGPGTGKTAVALHRAAYLLYTHRRQLERSGVLVVGPSPAFLHYIDQVLPSLGETGVVSRTIGDLVPGHRATSIDDPLAARLKGQRRMANAIANAVAARERVPKNLPTIKINGIRVPMLKTDVLQALEDAKHTRSPHNKARETFIKSVLSAMRNRYIEQLDYTPEQAEISDVANQLKLSDDIRKTLNLAWLPMTGPWLIDQMFSKPAQLQRFAPWLTDDEIQLLTRPKGSPLTVSDIPLLDEAMELLGPDPKVTARQAAEKAQRAAEEQFAKDTLAQAGIGSGIVTSSMLLDNINGLDSEMVAQQAANDREWTYGHIVVDEAQELTAMDWRMLMRRCPSRSFTIVGDVAQTSALGGTRRWDKRMDALFGEAGWDLHELTINYRNPEQVSDLSSKFAENEGLYISTTKAVRDMPGSVQRVTVEQNNEELRSLTDSIGKQATVLVERFIDQDGTGRLAIITPLALADMTRRKVYDAFVNEFGQNRAAMLMGLHDADGEKTGSNMDLEQGDDAPVTVCDTQMVKGLEYDAVILVQPGMIGQEAPSRRSAASDLYVAMTRPTQQLTIVRTPTDTTLIEL